MRTLRKHTADKYLGAARTIAGQDRVDPFADQLEAVGIEFDQSALNDQVLADAGEFDPTRAGSEIRGAADWYDAAMQDRIAGLDAMRTGLLNAPSHIDINPVLAAQRAAAMGAARGARGDTALLSREADFAQAAAERGAMEQARVAQLEEAAARRGLASDIGTAAANAAASAAAGWGKAYGAAGQHDLAGSATQADMLKTGFDNIVEDASMVAGVADMGADLRGKGLDVRADIAESAYGGYRDARDIERGTQLMDLEEEMADQARDFEFWGSMLSTGANAVKSFGDEDE